MTKWNQITANVTEAENAAIENYMKKQNLANKNQAIRKAIQESVGIYPKSLIVPESVKGAFWLHDRLMEQIIDPIIREKFEKSSLELISRLWRKYREANFSNIDEESENYIAFSKHSKRGRPKIIRTRGKPVDIGYEAKNCLVP